MSHSAAFPRLYSSTGYLLLQVTHFLFRATAVPIVAVLRTELNSVHLVRWGFSLIATTRLHQANATRRLQVNCKLEFFVDNQKNCTVQRVTKRFKNGCIVEVS